MIFVNDIFNKLTDYQRTIDLNVNGWRFILEKLMVTKEHRQLALMFVESLISINSSLNSVCRGLTSTKSSNLAKTKNAVEGVLTLKHGM